MAQDYEKYRLGYNLRRLGITRDACEEDPSLWRKVKSKLSTLDINILLKDWYFLARDEQLPPPQKIPGEDWETWFYCAGRGAGKTRSGAEWAREKIKSGLPIGHLIAPTAAAARDVLIEGESGMISVCQTWDVTYDGKPLGRPLFEPSKKRLTWANGAKILYFSAEEPESLRGPQCYFLWGDELVAWDYPESWDMALFGLRLGENPQSVITSTPKSTKIIRKYYKEGLDPSNGQVVMTIGKSERNAKNLAPRIIQRLRRTYAGTSQERQELDGVLLEESQGALWTRAVIDDNRVKHMPNLVDTNFSFSQIAIGVDPALTNKEDSDSTGIVVAGRGVDDQAYVFADYTGKYSPRTWGEKVAHLYELWGASRVIMESNVGGDLVKEVMNNINPNIPLLTVHTTLSKVVRAEPVVALYEQGKIHHVGYGPATGEGQLHELEDQMCNWERLGAKYSPDRIDALVYSLYFLMIGGESSFKQRKILGLF